MFKKIIYKIWSLFLNFISYFNFSKHPFNLLFIRWKIEKPKTTYVDYKNSIEKIQKGDIVFYRTINTLTDFMIPGFWAHAGIVIDNDLNMIHATYPKVTNIHFYDFTRFCSDYIIIRLNLNENQINNMIVRVSEQLDKPYDFSARFTNDDRFMCTELISYGFKPYSDIIGLKLIERSIFGLYKQKTLTCDDILKYCKYKIIYNTVDKKENYE